MKPHISVIRCILPLLLSAGSFTLAEDETVEGILGYKDTTLDIYNVQDLADAVASKHNFTIILHNSVTVTEALPYKDKLLQNGPCWESDTLFNLSNYLFKAADASGISLSFSPASGAGVGKVIRNGRAEFRELGDLSFSNISNSSSDMEGTFTPFQPVSLASTELLASGDTTACYGYGGVFSSASGLTKDENGGVGIYDCYGGVSFNNITYDGSGMGDVNCGIYLRGGAIYTDSEWNTEIKNNGRDDSGGVTFNNVHIVLNRSGKYDNSSACYFYAYGGGIHTRDLIIDSNHGAVSFTNIGITQTAVHHDEGYGYGGALYLTGSSNSISDNSDKVTFSNCSVETANTARGGAVYLAGGATLTISGNEDVKFTTNSAKASAIYGTTNKNAVAQGGAIYLASNSKLNICNNSGDVYLSNNEVSAGATYAGASASAAGGAIYGSSGSDISICDNRMVYISYNTAPQGSAIYTDGSLSIRNNAYTNIHHNGENAICMTNSNALLALSAAQGGTIYLSDSLSIAGKAELNADYNGKSQSGTIEFYAASAVIKGSTSLQNGTLKLRTGSKLESTLNMSSAATLAADGTNNFVDKIQLSNGSTLALTVGSANTEAAVLNTNIITTNGSYNLHLTFNGVPRDDTKYILLQLAEDAGYSQNAWNEQNILVSGDISFSDLKWINEDTTLIYTHMDLIWMNSTGSDRWDHDARNWVHAWDEAGAPINYSDNCKIGFTDACQDTSDVIILEELAPASILVNAERDYTFIAGGGSITGSTGLVKKGSGTLTLALNNTFTGGITVEAGGTLRAHSNTALGEDNINNFLSLAQGATLIVDNGAEVFLSSGCGNTAIRGNVQVAQDAALYVQTLNHYWAEKSVVNGTLIFSSFASNDGTEGETNFGTGAGKLFGNGTLKLTANDGSPLRVTFAENAGYTGSILLEGSNNIFTMKAGGYTGSGTLAATDYAGKSALIFEKQDVTLQEGGKLHIKTGNSITAQAITLQGGSTLLADNSYTTASALVLSAEATTAPIQATTFTLLGGSLYEQDGAYYSLAGVEKLILDGSNGQAITLSTDLQPIETTNTLFDRYILFTDVTTWESLGQPNYTILTASGSQAARLVYEGSTLYLETIPEPTGTTLSIVALAALLTRRRRTP